MENQPSLIMSSLDVARLDRLLESPACAHQPGIDALREEIGRATLVEPEAMPAQVVTMNSRVRFADENNGATHELTLVYPEAAAPGTVSVTAPVGSALLGLSAGQSIVWQVPDGRQLRLRVLEVLRQPEAEGEYHR